MLKQYLNKGISTPRALFVIIVLASIVGAFTLWQYSEIQKKEVSLPEIKISKKRGTKKDSESVVLRKIRGKIPKGFEIKTSKFFDIDGDKNNEIAVQIFNKNLPSFEKGQQDIYIFREDTVKKEMQEVYRDEGYGLTTSFFSYDFERDGKEELLIERSSGGTTSGLVWYILYEDNGVIKKIKPPIKDLSQFGLGKEYTIPGRNTIEITEKGLIKETAPLHIVGTGPWWSASGGFLILYYQFKDNKLEIIDYIIESSKQISDWKTYRNEEYGFEIKCPKEWQVKANGFEIKCPTEWQRMLNGFEIKCSKERQVKVKGLGLNPRLLITFEERESGTYFGIGVNYPADFPSAEAQCVNSEEIKIAGIETQKTNHWSYAPFSSFRELSPTECREDPSLTNIYARIEKEEDVYEFVFFCKKKEWKGQEGREKCNDLYDSIVSTFSFFE